jgi:hypothetical protein
MSEQAQSYLKRISDLDRLQSSQSLIQDYTVQVSPSGDSSATAEYTTGWELSLENWYASGISGLAETTASITYDIYTPSITTSTTIDPTDSEYVPGALWFEASVQYDDAGKITTNPAATALFRSKKINFGELLNNLDSIESSYLKAKYADISAASFSNLSASILESDVLKTTILEATAITANTGHFLDDVLVEGDLFVKGTSYLTAMAACWADLAELYACDIPIPIDSESWPGTLVKFGGSAEITLASSGEVNAVVTDKPGMLMNTKLMSDPKWKDQDITPLGIVLVGRSVVKILGPINKFDKVGVSSNYPGVGASLSGPNASPSSPSIGIALESNQDSGVKLVECALQISLD